MEGKVLVNMQTLIEEFVTYFESKGLKYTDTSYIKLKKEGTTLAGVYRGTKVSNFFIKVLNESDILKNEILKPYKALSRKKYTITYFKIKKQDEFETMMKLIGDNINDIIEIKNISEDENKVVVETENKVETENSEEKTVISTTENKNTYEEKLTKDKYISEENTEKIKTEDENFNTIEEKTINKEAVEEENTEDDENIEMDPEKMQSILTDINKKLKTLFSKQK